MYPMGNFGSLAIMATSLETHVVLCIVLRAYHVPIAIVCLFAITFPISSFHRITIYQFVHESNKALCHDTPNQSNIVWDASINSQWPIAQETLRRRKFGESLLVTRVITLPGSHRLWTRHTVPYLPLTRLGIRESPGLEIFRTSPKLISVGSISPVVRLYLWRLRLRLNSDEKRKKGQNCLRLY